MFEEPPLPEDENDHAARMYLDGDSLVVEMNTVALANFRWSLWWLTTCPPREDISISNSDLLPVEMDCTVIKYCEITMTGEGPISGELYNPNAEFLHRETRVDLFVNRAQAKRAYQDLAALTEISIGREATLFGNLLMRLIGSVLD